MADSIFTIEIPNSDGSIERWLYRYAVDETPQPIHRWDLFRPGDWCTIVRDRQECDTQAEIESWTTNALAHLKDMALARL